MAQLSGDFARCHGTPLPLGGNGSPLQSPHALAPILPSLGPTQPPGRENSLGAAWFARLRACGKKYILAATEHGRRADSRSAGPVLPMEMS